MNGIREILRDPSYLTEQERSEVLKLLWTLDQAPPDVREWAEAELTALLDRKESSSSAFMREIRRIARSIASR